MHDLLSQPEYLHALVNPALTHALPLAAAALLFSVVFRLRSARALSLGLVLVSSAAVWPVVHYGEDGYDRMTSAADERGGEWLDLHRARAESGAWLFYVTAAAALAALVLPLRWPRSATPLTALTLALSLGACAMAAYIAYPAGKIRHREFRHGPPPPAELKAARDNR